MDISRRIMERYVIECTTDEYADVIKFFDPTEYSVDSELLSRGDGTYYVFLTAERDLEEEWPDELIETDYSIQKRSDKMPRFDILVDFGEEDDD